MMTSLSHSLANYLSINAQSFLDFLADCDDGVAFRRVPQPHSDLVTPRAHRDDGSVDLKS